MDNIQFDTRLEQLIGNGVKDRFLKEYWERDYFHAHSYSRESIKFNIQDLETVLACSRLTSNDLRLSSVDQEVLPIQYCEKDGTVKLQQAFFYFNRGSTIIIRSIENFNPQLRKLCFDLKAEFGNIRRIFINLYLTPEGSQGFFHHYDREDVFILQIYGEKEWYLYDSPLPLPLEDQGFSSSTVPDQNRLKKLVLKPENALYIPRGMIHEAKAQTGISCHLTISLVPFTWYDVIKEYHVELSHSNVSLRKSIPKTITEKDLTNQLNSVAKLNSKILRKVLNKMKFSYIDQLLNQFNIEGKLTEQRTITDQNLIVGLNSSLFKGHSIIGNTIEMKIGLTSVLLPLQAKSIVEYILKNRKCKIKDIPSKYKNKGKMMIINRLIRDSFLLLVNE